MKKFDEKTMNMLREYSSYSTQSVAARPQSSQNDINVALAYLSLLISNLNIGTAVWEYRHNFDQNIGSIRNHSMRHLACGLAYGS